MLQLQGKGEDRKRERIMGEADHGRHILNVAVGTLTHSHTGKNNGKGWNLKVASEKINGRHGVSQTPREIWVVFLEPWLFPSKRKIFFFQISFILYLMLVSESEFELNYFD